MINNILKVYFSSRDKNNKTYIFWATFDIADNFSLLDMSTKPEFNLGNVGEFDENGTITTEFEDGNTTVTQRNDGGVDINITIPPSIKKNISSNMPNNEVNYDENGTLEFKAEAEDTNVTIIVEPNGDSNTTVSGTDGNTILNIPNDINITVNIDENGTTTTTFKDESNTTFTQNNTPSIEINTTSEDNGAINIYIENNATVDTNSSGLIVVRTDDNKTITKQPNGDLNITLDSNGTINIPSNENNTTIVDINGTINIEYNSSTGFHANLNEKWDISSWSKERIDKILLDPARSGALEACQQLLQLNAQTIVYVSCDPATLARDSKILLEGGYRIEKIAIIDMFSQTKHVETMVLFQHH